MNCHSFLMLIPKFDLGTSKISILILNTWTISVNITAWSCNVYNNNNIRISIIKRSKVQSAGIVGPELNTTIKNTACCTPSRSLMRWRRRRRSMHATSAFKSMYTRRRSWILDMRNAMRSSPSRNWPSSVHNMCQLCSKSFLQTINW